MPSVNPEILRWARETAGLTPEAAAERLQIRPSKGRDAASRLLSLENGENEPTRPMLLKMAQQYRRPILTFYLSRPPRRGDRGQDFRTLPDDHAFADEALLDALIRSILARQGLIRAAIEEEEGHSPLQFIGSMSAANGVEAVIGAIRSTLIVSLDEFRSQPSPRDAFAYLRNAAERVGIFVLLMGNLGTHHTAIALETFRGFALADPVAPFVVINDQDSPSAWSFTLVHELAHLWLGQTGVDGLTADRSIERFCNDVAAAFLLPRAELLGFSLGHDSNIRAVATHISEFARERNLSSSMVAYGLWRARIVDDAQWQTLRGIFREHWLEERRRRREDARDREGGPNYYVVRGHRVGKGLMSTVEQMLGAGSLTTSKASAVLGVKPKQLQALFETRPRD